jgi:creatinine amidohydrolase
LLEPDALANLTWQEAAARLARRPVGLLPIGAIEAHGPHLPLNADVIIAEATAARAAARLQHDSVPAMVLPAVVYGVSFAGTSFPGTSPADPEPFEHYLAGVLTHLGRQGYRALICCNAHLEPAHVERVQAACVTAERAARIPVRFPDQRTERYAALLSDEFRAGARHAGAYETSILLASSPEAVRVESMRALDPIWIDLPARLRAGARTFAEAGAELGYFGDPAAATVDEGERMLDALAQMILLAYKETTNQVV